MRAMSTINMLMEQLAEIQSDTERLVAASPTRYNQKNLGGFVVVGGPDYSFVKPEDLQLQLQIRLKAAYDRWYERFRLLFPEPPRDVEKKIEKAHESVSCWIALGRNYKITSHQEQNAQECKAAFAPFFELLGLLDEVEGVFVIPDTNALIGCPDPKSYRTIAGRDSFTILLLPTVLAELDRLKLTARDPGLREKVKKLIRRIKGWRGQGSLISGVTLYKTITVRAIPHEPRVEESLGWLDETNNDDRIIAAVLEVQSAFPTKEIVLVTSDINLQNKAEAAQVPCAETP